MVAQCANPDCKREFHELSKGRLFLLPPTRDIRDSSPAPRLIDHCYWLCPKCASAHTIMLDGTKPMVCKLEPAVAKAARL